MTDSRRRDDEFAERVRALLQSPGIGVAPEFTVRVAVTGAPAGHGPGGVRK